MNKKILTLSLLALTMISLKTLAASDYPFIAKSTKAHKLILLNHSLASLEQRLQMIERAKKSIDVEYFIYRTDNSSKIFTQALVKKARQGVKIKVLLDYFMVKSEFSTFYAHELQKSGVEVKYFNTTATLNLFSGQYRNHRKVLIVDGIEAITGGRNIGDEYFDLSAEYNFLDRDIYLQGEIITPIKKTFDETFADQLSEYMSRPEIPKITESRYSKRDEVNTFGFDIDLRNWNDQVIEAIKFIENPMDKTLEAQIRKIGKSELLREYRGICNEITFHSEYPNIGKINRRTNRVVKYDIFDRINNSKKSIMIDSPYFIVNDELGSTLINALNRNVDVKLLTNSLNSTDATYVYAVFDRIIPKWLSRGLDSYIFKGARPESYEVLKDQTKEARFGIHAKTLIFDHKDVMIGTYNIDPRSANFNSEMIVTCENNAEFADAVQKDIDTRLEASIHLNSKAAIDEAQFYQTSFGKRIYYYLIKGPVRFFEYLL